MNQEQTYSLFSNFQSTVFKAIKTFLKTNKQEKTDKLIATTLRIPLEIKNFYECIAEAEMTSINTAIVTTLSKVKDQTISEYEKSYTKINENYDYQVTSFLKIINDHKIEYNDLDLFLEWLTDFKPNRADLTNKGQLVNLIDKKAQLKMCQTFGYSYDWLQNNSLSIYYKWPSFQHRWYKNVQYFVQDLIINFYLDETVESFELSFLCCDRNVVNNIISGTTPNIEENITPIVIANRHINGIETRTYHRLESNNINYEKCRNHFIVLIKMIFLLVKHNLIKFPNGYCLTPQQHDMIQDGSMHLATLFNNNHFSNDFYLDDLVDLNPKTFTKDKTNITSTPNLNHCLNISFIHDLLTWTDPSSSSVILTDELASKCRMNKMALVNYLRLFEKNYEKLSSNSIFLPSENQDTVILNLTRIRELESDRKEHPILDTAFG